jgi:hypothetical protein
LFASVVPIQKLRRTKSVSISDSRWLAYATASVATSLAGANPADAEIHYSGPLNRLFDAHSYHSPARHKFHLNAGSAYFGFANSLYPPSQGPYGEAGFLIRAPVSAKFAGVFTAAFRYVSQLNSGDNISSRPFIRNGPQFGGLHNKLGVLLIYYYNYGQWHQLDTGFVGFKFNSGIGVQYGWARVHIEAGMTGAFTLIDYAYADPGEPIRAGQSSSNEMVPEEGSLGWLALGAAGLLAWRKRRLRAMP